VIGESGSGKSTLARLLAGLDSPTEGALEFDGRPLSALPDRTISEQIGFVSPDSALFHASIRENISLSNPSIPLEEVEAAAEQAHVAREIRALNGGYQHCFDPAGSVFSIGQRQRLTLARALVKKPQILILDEATASLDLVLETAILANLRSNPCTQVLVSHRPSAMRHATRLIVMVRGAIDDDGTPNEVALRNPVARQFLNSSGATML